MPNTLYQDIRAALQVRLGTVSGIPIIAYEAVPFTPVVGTPFVDCKLVPASSRPATMGDQHLVQHEGSFEITVNRPTEDQGTAVAEALADLIKSSFKASDVLTSNDNSVRIRYSERGPVLIDENWIRVPISVGWYLFSPDY